MEISAIMLNFEELLHNTDTREIIAECIQKRNTCLLQLIENAMVTGEIDQTFTAEELKCTMMGILSNQLLDRRYNYHAASSTLKEAVLSSIDKLLLLVRIG